MNDTNASNANPVKTHIHHTLCSIHDKAHYSYQLPASIKSTLNFQSLAETTYVSYSRTLAHSK